MLNLIQDVLESDEKSDLRQFASQLHHSEKKYLLRNDIVTAFSEYCTTHKKPEYFYRSSHLGQLVYYTQEIILENELLYLIIRPKIASQEVYRVLEDLTVEPVSVQELLDLRDRRPPRTGFPTFLRLQPDHSRPQEHRQGCQLPQPLPVQ